MAEDNPHAIEQEYYDGIVSRSKGRMEAFDNSPFLQKELGWQNDPLYFAAEKLKAKRANA